MKKKLSLVIPHYKEDSRYIKRMLDSIALQQQINFDDIEVIIVNDGDECVLADELLNKYEFDVNYHINTKKGVSGARNYGLKQSKGKYVMFCDCDDMFISPFAIFIIFREIDNGGFDGLICNFLQETKMPDGNFNYIEMPMNRNFVHGKVMNKGFMDRNKIYFNEASNVHEDFCMLAIASAYTTNIKYCPMPLYGWMWAEGSVCRRDPLYLQKTTVNLLMNASYVLEHLLKNGRNDIARETAFSMIMDIYYSLNRKDWLDYANKEWRDLTEGTFKFFYETYKKYADELQEDKRNAIIAGQKQMHIQQGVLLEDITFKDWIKHIESEEVKPLPFKVTSNPFIENE